MTDCGTLTVGLWGSDCSQWHCSPLATRTALRPPHARRIDGSQPVEDVYEKTELALAAVHKEDARRRSQVQVRVPTGKGWQWLLRVWLGVGCGVGCGAAGDG